MKPSTGNEVPHPSPFAVTMAFVASRASAQTITSDQQPIVNAARGVFWFIACLPMSLTWNGVTKSTWPTDSAGGDGQRMRNAILRFARVAFGEPGQAASAQHDHLGQCRAIFCRPTPALTVRTWRCPRRGAGNWRRCYWTRRTNRGDPLT